MPENRVESIMMKSAVLISAMVVVIDKIFNVIMRAHIFYFLKKMDVTGITICVHN